MKTVPRDVAEVYLALAWPGPGAEDPKAMMALDVAQYVLGQGRASRLYQRLHEEQRLVTTITATYPAHRLAGVFVVLATCTPERADAAREAIVRETTALGSEKPSSPEVTRARRLLISHHLLGRETTSGHTSSVGYYHTLLGSPEFDDQYPDLVAKVTPVAIAKVAQQFLLPEKVATVAVHPRGRALGWGPSGAEGSP